MLHTLTFVLLGVIAASGALIAFRPGRWSGLVTVAMSILVGCLAGWLAIWVFSFAIADVPSLVIAFIASALVSWLVASSNAQRRPQRISSSTTRAALTNIPALDGIRGIAILLVLIEHSWIPTWTQDTVSRLDQTVSFIYLGGWVGVDLFFVLSGFLITSILWQSRGHQNYFRNFYARRVLRIFPLYYGVLALYFVVGPHLPAPPDLGDAGKDQVWYWLYLSNIPMAKHGTFAPSALGVSWSLAIEEQFYLIWPPVVLLLGRSRLMLLSIGIMIAALCWRVALVSAHINPQTIYVLLPSQMDGLAAGAFVALAVQSERLLFHIKRWTGLVGTLAAAAFVAIGARAASSTYAFFEGDGLMQTVGYTAIAVMFACLVIGAVTATPGAFGWSLFRTRLLRAIGKYSYGMYLLHRPVLAFLAVAFLPGLLSMSRGYFGLVAPAQIPYTVVFVTATVGVAWLSWNYFERPFLYLKRFVGYLRLGVEDDDQGARALSQPPTSAVTSANSFGRPD